MDVLFSKAAPGLGTANQSTTNMQCTKVAGMDSSLLRLARLFKAMLKY